MFRAKRGEEGKQRKENGWRRQEARKEGRCLWETGKSAGLHGMRNEKRGKGRREGGGKKGKEAKEVKRRGVGRKGSK